MLTDISAISATTPTNDDDNIAIIANSVLIAPNKCKDPNQEYVHFGSRGRCRTIYIQGWWVQRLVEKIYQLSFYSICVGYFHTSLCFSHLLKVSGTVRKNMLKKQNKINNFKASALHHRCVIDHHLGNHMSFFVWQPRRQDLVVFLFDLCAEKIILMDQWKSQG